jgi:hypothetical protein
VIPEEIVEAIWPLTNAERSAILIWVAMSHPDLVAEIMDRKKAYEIRCAPSPSEQTSTGGEGR